MERRSSLNGTVFQYKWNDVPFRASASGNAGHIGEQRSRASRFTTRAALTHTPPRSMRTVPFRRFGSIESEHVQRMAAQHARCDRRCGSAPCTIVPGSCEPIDGETRRNQATT
jgi:hypothetical protein